MIFNRFVLLLAMFGFMSPLAVSASMEADVAGSGGPVSHVGTGFFSEDGDLVPRYKTLFEEVAKEITDLFPGTLTDSDGWWKKCLSPMKPPYNQAPYCRFSDSDSCSYAYGSPVHERLEGIDYVKGPDYFTGKLVYFPLSMDSVSPQTIPPLIPPSMDPRWSEVIESTLFDTLQIRCPFLCFMPLLSSKETLSYGVKPYESYVHQQWVGVTSDPSLVLTSHRAGPCMLFGVLNRESGKCALFHANNHISNFRYALYLIDQLAENKFENLDIQIACGQLCISSLVFALALNKIMKDHTGLDRLISLHVFPSINAGGVKGYYRDEDVKTALLTRSYFAIGMTVSLDGINVFDSDHANDVFQPFDEIAPCPLSKEALLLRKPTTVDDEIWNAYIGPYMGMFDRYEEYEKKTETLEMRHLPTLKLS